MEAKRRKVEWNEYSENPNKNPGMVHLHNGSGYLLGNQAAQVLKQVLNYRVKTIIFVYGVSTLTDRINLYLFSLQYEFHIYQFKLRSLYTG